MLGDAEQTAADYNPASEETSSKLQPPPPNAMLCYATLLRLFWASLVS